MALDLTRGHKGTVAVRGTLGSIVPIDRAEIPVPRKNPEQRFASPGGGLVPDAGYGERVIRDEFWRIANELFPEAFDELHSIAVPVALIGRWSQYCADRWHEPATDPSHIEFEQCLAEWCCAHRIASLMEGGRPSPTWVIDRARETRLAWAASHRVAGDVSPVFGTTASRSSVDSPPEFDAAADTKASYERATREFAHLQIESARAEGWERAPRFTPEHLRWVARWRFGNESPRLISVRLLDSEDAVRTAAARMARRLDLPPLG